jgi:hypothetical protein
VRLLLRGTPAEIREGRGERFVRIARSSVSEIGAEALQGIAPEIRE